KINFHSFVSTTLSPSSLPASSSPISKTDTIDYFKIWLKNVFFPNVKSKSLLWIDSWTGHCPDSVKPVKPSDKEVEVMIIPKGSTRNIQPLDLFGLRVWENFLKHFSDSIIIYGDNSNLHL
ncbi:hypothetical protein PV325_010303, partial [Microctonus aethiopoides]